MVQHYIGLNQEKDGMPWSKGQTCSTSSMGFLSYILWSELPQLFHNHHKMKYAPIRYGLYVCLSVPSLLKIISRQLQEVPFLQCFFEEDTHPSLLSLS